MPYPRSLLFAVALALLVGGQATAEAEDDRVVTFSFQDEDVRVVLTAIVEFAQANMVLSPEVEGRVTLRLSAVPWRDALVAAARAVGAAVVEEEGDILRVAPAPEPAAPAAEETLEVYKIGDLMMRFDLLELLRPIAPASWIKHHYAVLLVRGDARTQEAVRALLTALRAAPPPPEPVDPAPPEAAEVDVEKGLADVAAQMEALREEVQALRKEIREVKELLLRK